MNDKNLIRLYGNATFDRGGKARWLLNEMKVNYEDRWLDKEKNEIESAEYLKLNPMGRVPAAEINGHLMFESGAICAYLADLYLEKSLAPKLDAPERADYQKWMYFASAMIDSLQWRLELIDDLPPSAALAVKQKELLEDLRDILKTLDQSLAKTDFLVGNRFSAADICVSYQLYWHRFWPESKALIETFPRVDSYIDRMLTRPAAKTAEWPRPPT
jgi:glutathione S-transferase